MFVTHLPAFVRTVCDPASLEMSTCYMSVPSQQRGADGFSSTSCFHQAANPSLNFTWRVLIYYTLINSTKKALGQGDHCQIAAQLYTPA